MHITLFVQQYVVGTQAIHTGLKATLDNLSTMPLKVRPEKRRSK